MNTRIGFVISAACVFALVATDQRTVCKEKPKWQVGQLVAAQLSGYGSNPKSSDRRASGRGDLWWEYCVSSGGKAVSAVSRVSPTKSELSVGHAVRFTIDRNRIQILNLKGEHFTMRIIRQGDESICH